MTESARATWRPGGFVSNALLMAFVGIIGLFAMALWGVVFQGVALSLLRVDSLTVQTREALASLGVGAGALMVTAGYVAWSDRTWAVVDLERPTLRDAAWTVLGVVVLVGIVYAISTLAASLGIEFADHAVVEAAADDPSILLPLIPISILVVGPGEELLYRNVVQKHLYDYAPRWGAIVATSCIFAAVHFPAYIDKDSTGAVAITLASIFLLSLVLGVVYARTDNVLVPALVHGIYNAISFGTEYLELVNALVATAR